MTTTMNVAPVKDRSLVTFGDSFVEGFIKIPRNLPDERKEICFPTVLQNKYGIDVENHGEKGFSEAGIARKVRNWIYENNMTMKDSTGGNKAVLVVWPASWGRQYKWDKETDDFVPLGYTNRFYPNSEDESTVFHDWNTSGSIAYTAMLLDHFNIPYLFTRSLDIKKTYRQYKLQDPEVFYPNWIRQKVRYNGLLDICIGRWYNTPEENRYTNTVELCKKFLDDTVTECNHPTPKGHVLIADTLYPYIKEILTGSN